MMQSNNLNILANPSFQGVNRMFVLAYPTGANDPTRNDIRKLYFPTGSVDGYNVSIDGRNFFNSNIKIADRRGYENLRDVMIGNGDDYTVGSLIDYKYFKDTYKLIAIDLSRQKILDADPRAIQQINFKASTDAEYDIYIS